jgi:ubiquinone/menaquinone biosynthesis C-methylase UbiE
VSDLSGKPDFRGPATLTFESPPAEFEVQIDLRGHSQPIDGIFRWYGRVRPHEALQGFMEAAGSSRKGRLSTDSGEVPVLVSDVDFWGRYRVQGTGMPPYPLEPQTDFGSEPDDVLAHSLEDRALDRAAELLEPEFRTAAVTTDGYVELLGGTPAPSPTAASRAMNNPLVASIYEKLWRPAGAAMMGVGGISMSAERAKAVDDLRLSGGMKVLDVAAGPGNFTRYLSDHLSGDGIAIGFDISEQMIERAVRDNRGPHAAYMRGDAQSLPFADNTFDAVCCFAALYLIPNPLAVVDELVRVLRPGGRIAIMTSYGREAAPVKSVLGAVSGRIGVRMFDKDQFTSIFEQCGMTEIEQEVRGLAQFVSATNAH